MKDLRVATLAVVSLGVAISVLVRTAHLRPPSAVPSEQAAGRRQVTPAAFTDPSGPKVRVLVRWESSLDPSQEIACVIPADTTVCVSTLPIPGTERSITLRLAAHVNGDNSLFLTGESVACWSKGSSSDLMIMQGVRDGETKTLGVLGVTTTKGGRLANKITRTLRVTPTIVPSDYLAPGLHPDVQTGHNPWDLRSL